MRKGFLCGPVKKENQPPPVETETKEKPTVKIVETPKPTGAIPKIKDASGKKRRRTRSMGSSLSPSPGRGFFVPGFGAGGSSSSMSLSELM